MDAQHPPLLQPSPTVHQLSPTLAFLPTDHPAHYPTCSSPKPGPHLGSTSFLFPKAYGEGKRGASPCAVCSTTRLFRPDLGACRQQSQAFSPRFWTEPRTCSLLGTSPFHQPRPTLAGDILIIACNFQRPLQLCMEEARGGLGWRATPGMP